MFPAAALALIPLLLSGRSPSHISPEKNLLSLDFHMTDFRLHMNGPHINYATSMNEPESFAPSSSDLDQQRSLWLNVPQCTTQTKDAGRRAPTLGIWSEEAHLYIFVLLCFFKHITFRFKTVFRSVQLKYSIDFMILQLMLEV